MLIQVYLPSQDSTLDYLLIKTSSVIMKITIKKILFILLAFSASMLTAQQLPQLTINALNPYFSNPAYGGTTPYIEASLSSRYQWLSSDFRGKTPITNYLSFYAPYNRILGHDNEHSKKKIRSWNTIGGSFLYDQAAANTNVNAQLSFAHNVPLTKSIRMSSALSVGIQQFTTDNSDFILADPVDQVLNEVNRKKVLDVTASLWWYSDIFFGGISVKQALNQLEFGTGDNTIPLNRHYTTSLGAHFGLTHSSDMIIYYNNRIVQNVPISHELSSILIVNHRYWTGLSVRYKESVSLILGTIVAKRFDFTYAYDIPTGSLGNNFGSHEIILEYKLVVDDKIPCPDQFW